MDEGTREYLSRTLGQISGVRVIVSALVSISDDPARLRAAIDQQSELLQATWLAGPMSDEMIQEFEQVVAATKKMLPTRP